MTTIAERLFETYLQHQCAESALESALKKRFGELWYDSIDYTFDCYDRSIELYFTSRPYEQADAEWCIALGFERCWLHNHASEGCSRSGCDAGYFTAEKPCE